MNKKLYYKNSFKLFFVLFVTMFLFNVAHANIVSFMQSKSVTINMNNSLVIDILKEVQRQSGLNFAYNEKELSSYNKKSINVHNINVDDVLEALFANTDLSYKIVGNSITIVKNGKSVAQTKNQQKQEITIKGKIVDEDRKVVSGATIIVVGTSNGAITDDQGIFTLKLSKGDRIEVSCVGMMQQVIVAEQTNNDMVIVLKKDVLAVDDVVVNGYFAKSKSSFTGSAKSFTKEELRKVSNQNVLSTLSLIDPSFKMVENNLMGSDPNTLPEFTIRGGSDFSSAVKDAKNTPNIPLFVLDGFVVPVQQIYDLDPNRVENITILKDAAATSIYGSRAANGVVVVETVKLADGKLRVTYTGDINFEMPDITCYDVLNSEEKLQYEVISGLFKESGSPWFDESKRNLYNERRMLVAQGYNTDWLNKPINSLGVGHKHSALIEGGGDSFTYGMMLNYEDKKGVMKESDRERLGLNVKLQYRYKNLKLRNELSFQRVTANSSPFGSFSTYVKMNPYYPYLHDDGSYKKVLAYDYDAFGEATNAIVNPLYNGTLKSINRNVVDRMVNNFQLEWDIIESLKLKTQFSVSKDWGVDDVYKSDKHTDFENYSLDDLFRKGEYQKTNSEALSYSLNIVASYNKKFGDDYLSLAAGYEIVEDNNENMMYHVEGISDLVVSPSMALQYRPGSTPVGDQSTARSIGVFANASYSLKNRYFIEGSYRTDASSIYGENNRWGNFWSAGAGWNLHNEDFLKDSQLVSFLKLRASTGITGGQNFDPYQALKMYRFLNSSRYENWQGVDIMGIDNPSLKWQRKLKTNIGVDFVMFDSRLKGNIEYYMDSSKDNLTDVSLPPSAGFASYQDNLGNVSNAGVEIDLNYAYVRTSDLQSNFFVRLVHNKNKVGKISDDLVAFNKKQDATITNKPQVRYIEGESINTIWVVPSLGIDPATGNELFLNRYGVATNTWSPLDYVAMGSFDPKVEGSFGNNLTYKNFQLNIYLSYRLGANIYNQTLVDKVENSDPNRNVDRRAFDQGWKEPGNNSFFKRPGSTRTEATSRFVEKENYLKLASINASYTLPRDFCKKIKMQSAKITVFMNDIATWSSIAQERGIDYPFARNISASLQLVF